MQVWLLDSEKFVKVNGLKEVSNPIMFDSGNVPTKDGLFSTEIFGTSSRDRKETFAYIDLYKKFINPKIYLSLIRLNRNFESVIYGTKKFIIKNGILTPDENGDTGIDWLYKVWDDIKFEKNESNQRNERIDLLKNNKKDIIFSSKFVILPAFYRDVNIQSTDSNPKVPEINTLYSNIIRNVKVLKDASTMDFILQSISGKIQDSIVDVYNLIKEKIQGKNGYIRKFLMGKSVDYCSRVVITAAPYTANRVEDQKVDFYHTGVPLAQICSEFTPFMIFWLKNWFKNNLENQANGFTIFDDNGERVTVKLDNPAAYYNDEYIEKHLGQFVKTPSRRFDKIEIPVSKAERERAGLKDKPIYYKFVGMQLSGDIPNTIPADKYKPNVKRDLTWTDLIYRAAVDVTSDKHVWITRYPFLDYLGMMTTRITVLSTRDTVPMCITGTIYPNYPAVDTHVTGNIDVLFRDTVNLCPVYLAALGADHDGDQITCKSVFTQEANEECERILMSKSNLISIDGVGVRDNAGNEGIQTLYNLTRFRD